MDITATVCKLNYSPLARSSAGVYCRLLGSGSPVVFLHGGWGYEIYPLLQDQLISGCTTVIPDRSGYGRSSKPQNLIAQGFGADFHHRAAQETLLCLDQLNVHQFVLWGHSDGAVIAAMIGLSAPQRVRGIILEALHYDARKGSREFFRAMISSPESFGVRATTAMAREHGEPYWRQLLHAEGTAWVELAAAATAEHYDLFAGRLSQLTVPSVIIHGASDPRTESGELDSIRRELPNAEFHLIENAGHSPHSEKASAGQCTEIVERTIRNWNAPGEPVTPCR